MSAHERSKAVVREKLGSVLLHLALGAGAVFMLMPFFIMLRASFAPPEHVQGLGLSFTPTLDNYRQALDGANWPRYYVNSIVVSGGVLVLQIATALPAGYALARLNFRGRGVAKAVVLCCLVIPIQITAIPVYVGIARIGLADSLPGLILPFSVSAFGIYLFRQFVLTIPQNVFDSARIDGVGFFAMVWRVVLPNVRPAIVAFGVFSVTHYWNDLFWPSVVLRTDTYATVPFAVMRFASNESGSTHGAQMAAASLAVLPLVVAFLFAQRQFVSGLALTATTD